MTVAEIADLFSEALAPLAAYLSTSTADNNEYRRIVGFDAATGALMVGRDIDGTIANDDVVDVYLIVPRPDWRGLVNNALADLFFTERVSIPPVSGQSLYAMPAGAEWVQVEQQIERVLFRWQSNSQYDERDAPAYDVIDDANSISINFAYLPPEIDSIILEARRYYEPLANDAATTTCPEKLIRAQTKVEALRHIWNKVGEVVAKELFGAEMSKAEGELLDRKRQLVKQVQSKPLHLDRGQPGPDMAMPGGYTWGR